MLSLRSLAVALVLALVTTACQDANLPTDPTDLTARSALAGSSGCFTVEFTTVATSLGTRLEGTVSGDLEGTIDARATKIVLTEGRTLMVEGITEWEITGGVAGPMSFTTDIHLRNIFMESGLVRNVGRHRARSGLEKAKLTFEGESDFSVVPNVVVWVYHGVLCP